MATRDYPGTDSLCDESSAVDHSERWETEQTKKRRLSFIACSYDLSSVRFAAHDLIMQR